MLFAVVGAAGSVILFVCFGVLWIILAAYTFLIASRNYLVAFQGTAAGIDAVEWSDDPIVDWLSGALSLAAVLFFWLMPVGMVSRALQDTWLPGQTPLRFFLLAVPLLWFCFPISLLSALGPAATWAFPSPTVLGRLLRILPSVLLFYLCTALVLAAPAALMFLALFVLSHQAVFFLIPLEAGLVSAVLLVHARLVGRLGWLVSQVPQRPAADRRRPKRLRKAARSAAVEDPWATPDEEPAAAAPADGGAGYRVVEVEAEERRPPPAYLDNPEPDPYAMAAAPAGEPQPEAPRVAMTPAQLGREMALRSREPPPPPPLPLFSGVYTFPFYPTTLKAWLWQALFLLAALILTRMLVEFYPFTGGGVK